MGTTPIKTVADLVERLGGPTKAAHALETTPNNITNWKRFGEIPARFYLLHKSRLAEQGLDAPAHLWAFIPAHYGRDLGDEAHPRPDQAA